MFIIVICIVMLNVIWLRIIDCGLLVICELILMLWFIGFGCIMIVLGVVSVRCLGVRFYVLKYFCVDGSSVLFICLFCRCSMMIMLMFFSFLLRLWNIFMFICLRLFGSSVCGLIVCIFGMLSVVSVWMLECVMCECRMLLMIVMCSFVKLCL